MTKINSEREALEAQTEKSSSTLTDCTCTIAHKMYWTEWCSLNQLDGRTHHRMTHQQSKSNYIHIVNINSIKAITRTSSSGDQGDCTTESHRSPTIEVYTTNPVSQNRSI